MVLWSISFWNTIFNTLKLDYLYNTVHDTYNMSYRVCTSTDILCMNAQCNPFVVLFASAAGSQLTASKQHTTIKQPCHNQGNNSQTQDATHSIYHRQACHTISGVITQHDKTNCLQLSITSYHGLEPAGVVGVYHEYDKTKVVSAFFIIIEWI